MKIGGQEGEALEIYIVEAHMEPYLRSLIPGTCRAEEHYQYIFNAFQITRGPPGLPSASKRE